MPDPTDLDTALSRLRFPHVQPQVDHLALLASEPIEPLCTEGDVISRYSRADALRDGVLHDATDLAHEAGIRYPVALTAGVWARCVSVPPKVLCQSEEGRLWDVLYLLSLACRRARGDTLRFGVHVRNDNRLRTPPLVRLKALCHPGDRGEPCITVMLPEES